MSARDGDFDIRSPLSRGLWLCTLDGVPTADGIAVTPGSQTVLYRAQQSALAACFQDRAVVDPAASGVGLIPIDDDGTAPIPFVPCTP